MDFTSKSSTKDTAGGSSETASTGYFAETEMNAEQENFLYELETTDSGSLGIVLRAIYDCGDVKKFSRALDHRIHIYDRSIQNVCSHHYQNFVTAMRKMMTLQEKSAEIKNDFAQIDCKIQEASKDLAEKSATVVKYRKLTKNASTAIDQISLCLPALENYAKLQGLMEQKKYYQALKVLEELEHTHLALVEKYRFTQLFAKSLAPIREQIKQKAYSEFKDFLENIKKVAKRIGRHASQCTSEQHSFGTTDAERTKLLQEDTKKKSADYQVIVSADGSLVKRKVEKSGKATKSEQAEEDEKLSAQDLIDFTPVHRCCQIFNVLGAKEEFEKYYREQRTEQCKLVSQQATKKTTLRHYVDYLDEIIGFFVVEDRILDTEPSLGTSAHKEALWEDSLKKVIATMNTDFGMSLDVEMMLRMKKVILLFALTMKSYGYTIGPLYSLLQNFRDQYSAVLLKTYQDQFNRDLDMDNYSPILVNDRDEFKQIIRQFPFYRKSMEQEPFPRKFPFSRFVISTYGHAKSYLNAIFKFMEHLQLKHSEIDDTMRRHANILIKRWSEILKQYVSVKRNLVQLIQITINIGYLEKGCESLGSFITKLASGGDSAMTAGYQVPLFEGDFRDARSEVEQSIEISLARKVDDLLEPACYDWELPSSSGHASDFIQSTIAFLSTTFISFSEIPGALARHVCTQTCKHIAQRLSGMLLSPDVKALSPGALEQFSLDVMQCELFAATQNNISGLDSTTLPLTFAHLRQLLELVTQSDWTTYIAEIGKSDAKYNRVQPSAAVLIMEKMIEFEKKSAGFFAVNKGDRRKLYDTILKQLRAIASGH
ncbi:unnamed protein product, partial [Mesorhabditis spiculigera]